LDVIKLLKQQNMPFEKAQMRVKIMINNYKDKKLHFEEIPKLIKVKENENWTGANGQIIALIDPGNYKLIKALHSTSLGMPRKRFDQIQNFQTCDSKNQRLQRIMTHA
jgi:ribosome maturation protein Sdo1